MKIPYLPIIVVANALSLASANAMPDLGRETGKFIRNDEQTPKNVRTFEPAKSNSSNADSKDSKANVTFALPIHGGSLAFALPIHGDSLAFALPIHGGSLAFALPIHGGSLAFALPIHGSSLAFALPIHGGSLA
jgi:hypothetical protein